MLVVYLIHQNFFDIRYTFHNLNNLKFSIFYMQTLCCKDMGKYGKGYIVKVSILLLKAIK
ncbi:hypothetical protein PRABACTJOHN_04183 [Parabacteroides johnsonii DSM 18315]|uniref:Uncharacterized protein n=1 Tax=Parabacteroides johnsonii DSM 18315 TaxID=537006 RepID=B7BGI6_9BACT|nr:hypothetical protein PRABACTJOHN_04183 [Parabacteroides johnsonii DSM 18315]